MPATPRDSRAATMTAAAIAAFFAVLGLVVFPPEAVYSGDIGLKFVQARALADTRFASLDLPYPGEFLDPARQFFPIRPPFIMMARGETQTIFSPASAVLQGLVVSAGVRGLIVLSLISAAVVLFASARIAGAGHKTVVVVALGLASPLWLYAVLGWEHAPAVAFSTAGFAVALASRRMSTCAIAGVLVGIGGLVRDEVLLLLPGLLLVVALKHRSVRPVVMVCAGVVVSLLCGIVMEVLWFGRPVAAHLRHAVDLGPGIAPADSMYADVPVLEQLTFRARYETVIQYWLLGYGRDWWIVGFCSAYLAALIVRWRFPSHAGSIPLLLWTTGLVALAAVDLWDLTTAPKWLAGLHRVSPYLVFALLPPPATGERGDWYSPAVVATTAAYVLLAFATTNTMGGKSLGPRLLLPLFPLLTVAAVVRIAGYLRARAGVERSIGLAGVLLVAMTAALHLAGTMPAYYWRSQEDASTVLTAGAADARVIVVDDPFTAQLLFPLYYRKIIFLADTAELRGKLGTLLADAKVPEVLLISRQPEPGMSLSPLRIRQSDKVGRMWVQYWGRLGRVLN